MALSLEILAIWYHFPNGDKSLQNMFPNATISSNLYFYSTTPSQNVAQGNNAIYDAQLKFCDSFHITAPDCVKIDG